MESCELTDTDCLFHLDLQLKLKNDGSLSKKTCSVSTPSSL